MKILYKTVITLVIAAFFVSCQGYERLLKSSDYRKKYSEAKRYFDEGDYLRSATLFDQCAPVYRGAKQADTVFFYQAMSYYKQRDYILASHYFQNFNTTFGSSPFIKQSRYMEAYCYYMQSPRPSLDQNETERAIQAFQLYQLSYPDGEKAEISDSLIAELKDKLVEKSYISAKLYFDMEKYKASLVALNNSLIEYPSSKYREELMFMILKSSYMYAFKSISKKQKERYQASIDEYYSFIAEFPESEYEREAKRMYRQASKFLGGNIETEDEEELNEDKKLTKSDN